jgi:hypothetical protein
MAYRYDGQDLVISGFEDGISDNPYKGINDMRGVNIISVPGEASVSFAPSAINLTSVTGTIASADASTDKLTGTLTTGFLVFGQALIFTGGSLPAGITANTTYWVRTVSSQNPAVFTVSANIGSGGIVDITATGTGSFASIDIKDIQSFDKTTGAGIDSAGRVWALSGGTYLYLGNDVTSDADHLGTTGNGIIYFKGYLFAFYNHIIVYTKFDNGLSTPVAWTNWGEVFTTTNSISNSHDSIIAYGDVLYITDASYVVKVIENTGQTFDPANAATYTYTSKAFLLPKSDTATCLEQLGNNLLIGGIFNVIYQWDRTSTSYTQVIKIAENYIYRMVTVNTNTYIFAGKRGRIFYTNGSQAQLFSKVPDHISGKIDPVISWINCAYYKNQIYFGVSATDNAGNAITSYAGVWAIDITTNALRVPFLASTATAAVSAIYANPATNTGYGLIISWTTGTTYGIDSSSTSPYSSYVAYIETDLIPLGTYLKKTTNINMEFKLSAPLIQGESIKISARPNKFTSWTPLGETTAAGKMSDVYILNFDQLQWVQFRIDLKSVNIVSSPSFTRLFEIRLR